MTLTSTHGSGAPTSTGRGSQPEFSQDDDHGQQGQLRYGHLLPDPRSHRDDQWRDQFLRGGAEFERLLYRDRSAAWLAAFILFGLFLVPLLFIRCRLEGDRIRFRNYYRSYSFRWNEIAAVELVPASLWTVDTSWSMYPRCHLKTGDSVDVRALIHMRKKKAYAFKEFVERKAAEFGFKAEIDAEALRN